MSRNHCKIIPCFYSFYAQFKEKKKSSKDAKENKIEITRIVFERIQRTKVIQKMFLNFLQKVTLGGSEC